ncbi:hypothetical protein POJ06DRAFT_90701 [Lipomyces tetrasporus]|uniref:Mitochondrial distribution and morphology protein 10 n=1 Tax=Lipomyces tetrasporus TaxID=54092 RepID=A0AAD7QTV7_9ASCO|nr:uncharacterized protein POJ06DRAFT_90701 [Lipomyces tetrasporus]KAJ8101193.1 hypothetical protein POJ06DRAFT_90701 [Lipomyces tetrasporus]
MHSYLEHILESFYAATNWNAENQYSNLTASSRELLDFSLPTGFILNVSALSSPASASSYSVKNLSGIVDGAISYFYCAPNNLLSSSRLSTDDVELTKVLCGYRPVKLPEAPEDPKYREIWLGGKRIDIKNTLLYGKLYLPNNILEAMYIRQLSPTDQIVISAVSDSRLRNGGTMMTQIQKNAGKWCSEFIYSTDEALLGLRGLYNFGFDSKLSESSSQSLLSAGGEIYYGVFNKAAGVSTGLRYATSSAYVSTPMTMTVTLNPIMGQLSATYAVKSTTNTTFASRLDFNAFSYESDLTLGCELWKRSPSNPTAVSEDLLKQPLQSEESLLPSEAVEKGQSERSTIEKDSREDTKTFVDEAVWKARVSTSSPTIKLLWEGRVKAFLFSLGAEIDVRPGQGVKTFGLELQYAS